MAKSPLENLGQLKGKLSEEQFSLVRDLFSRQDAAWQRRLNQIPIFAPLLAAFGLVATFYGLEKLLDQTFLANEPLLLLALGIATLLITGVFYRKLQ